MGKGSTVTVVVKAKVGRFGDRCGHDCTIELCDNVEGQNPGTCPFNDQCKGYL